MKTGIELIAEERQEQIKKHGFTLVHDTETNDCSELLFAAEFLLTHDWNKYPRNWDLKYLENFNSKTKLERIIIAGALIAAEIDRLQSKL